jgi:deazaflavin-dependent oxidoreductase (nitroreductase family)
MSRLNPLVAAVLRSPVHWLASPGLMLLTYTGRKSGRQFSIPVGYQLDGDEVTVMVSEAHEKRWWRNFREPGDVELHLRGRLRQGRAALVPADDPHFRASAENVLRRVPGMGRVFKVDFDRRAGLTEDQLEQLGNEIVVVRITLEPAA